MAEFADVDHADLGVREALHDREPDRVLARVLGGGDAHSADRRVDRDMQVLDVSEDDIDTQTCDREVGAIGTHRAAREGSGGRRESRVGTPRAVHCGSPSQAPCA